MLSSLNWYRKKANKKNKKKTYQTVEKILKFNMKTEFESALKSGKSFVHFTHFLSSSPHRPYHFYINSSFSLTLYAFDSMIDFRHSCTQTNKHYMHFFYFFLQFIIFAYYYLILDRFINVFILFL